MVERMEKVEESVRSMVAAVGVLSRTVEKLGVRFRVLRRTLRDPISEVLLIVKIPTCLRIRSSIRILDSTKC